MKSTFKPRSLGALVVVSLFASPVHAFDYELWLKAAVRIDANGHVDHVAWRNTRDSASVITERLDPIIRSWVFEPGRINGTAVATDTFLTLQVLGEEKEDGAVNLSLGTVRTGAIMDTLAPPRYPMKEARNGNSAELLATLDISPDGQVQVVDVQVEASRLGSGAAFVKSLKEAVAEWKPALERVGGIPVASSLQVPVQFCGPGDLGWCLKRDRERMERMHQEGEVSAPAGETIALESAVRLMTRVDGTGI
ncbi:MAG: hypothetical protein A2579_02180 [Lysobacterales bacterium RIFOXYD1_FULL_69_11]|nr:MAG: hypothetical protein A2190_05265 [Xanthomonadales bacterium RIFOXYA1_FULL_69_10]OHE88655.1 MAG: hypothetical protein A2579_02180 [Xanthomonadales bacterium RIFOXYD1_FULL_69_11]